MSHTTVLYVTVPYSSLGNCTKMQLDKEQEIGINILIDTPGIDLALIRNYLNNFDRHFIYSISATVFNNADLDILLPRLYILFSLSGCFAQNGNVIPVLLQHAGEQEPDIAPVVRYFQTQGETGIRVAVFRSTYNQLYHSVFFTSIEQLKIFGQTELALYGKKEINQVILSVCDAVDQEGQIHSAKKVIRDNKVCELFFRGITFKTNEKWFSHQLALWDKRSKLYLSFISLGKRVNEAEYYDMRNWYRQEYEILPLWYKRFGHILKVIMGKRTFRSLFNDNVKKYKD